MREGEGGKERDIYIEGGRERKRYRARLDHYRPRTGGRGHVLPLSPRLLRNHCKFLSLHRTDGIIDRDRPHGVVPLDRVCVH